MLGCHHWTCFLMLLPTMAVATHYEEYSHTNRVVPANIDQGSVNSSKIVNYSEPLFQIKVNGTGWVHTDGPPASISGMIPEISKVTAHWYHWQGTAETAPGASYVIGAQLNGHVDISAVISSSNCPWGTGYASVSLSSLANSSGLNFPSQYASADNLGGGLSLHSGSQYSVSLSGSGAGSVQVGGSIQGGNGFVRTALLGYVEIRELSSNGPTIAATHHMRISPAMAMSVNNGCWWFGPSAVVNFDAGLGGLAFISSFVSN